MDIVKNTLFLISLSGDVEYNELQDDFRVTIGSLSYVFTINVLPYGCIDISFSDKIKLYVTEDKSVDSLCVDIESYYSWKRRSSTDPPLRFIRKMLKHVKYIM